MLKNRDVSPGGDHEASNLAVLPSYAQTVRTKPFWRHFDTLNMIVLLRRKAFLQVAELTKQLEAAFRRGKPDPTPIKPQPAPAPSPAPGGCMASCAEGKPGCDCHCFCQVCHAKCGDGCYDKCLSGSGCSANCLP